MLGVLAVLSLASIGSPAILTDLVEVPDGDLATANCFRARIGAVQSGTTTSTGPGTTSVPITAVDPVRAFVLHTVSSDGADAVDGLVSVELTDATTLDVVRQGSGTANVTVAWHVVEYTCGIRVQRGVETGSASPVRDVEINVTDPARSFTTVAVAPGSAATTPDAAQQVTSRLAGPTTLRLEAATAPAADARWAWQVVEVVRDADVDAQHVTATLAPGDLATTVPLPAAVDPSRTLLLAGVRTAGGSLEQAAVTAELTATDEVTLQRGTAGVAATVELQVVELLDGTAVQRGSLTVADALVTNTAALASPVDDTRTTVLASGTGWGGAPATGRADAGTDGIGRALGRFGTDDPATVRVTRGRTDGATTWTYQAVTWGGPRWWDLAYGYRERIEVTTATTAAPDGYTVPVTFDHAAMVAAGTALASGDDVRVVRWDGSTWTELDRVLDDLSVWDAADTTVWFRTATPIAADTTDVSYWLHHGNGGAGAPPADADQVFLVTEDFEAGLGDFSERTTGTGWYAADDWSHRRTVTVPAGTVARDLADVPVLVALTDPTMTTQVQADGSDLRFTAADGVTPLPHELERWDAGTGQLLAWVRVPTVAAGNDTDLVLYWGATDAPAQADPGATWQGFGGVWHLAEDPTGQVPHADDSAPTGLDGALLGAAGTTVRTPGVVGDGIDLAADTGRLVVGRVTVGPTTPLTVSGWVTPDGTADGTVLRVAEAGTLHAALEVTDAGGGAVAVRASLRDRDGTLHTATGGTLPVGATGHVAATWDGATLTAWLDGSAVAATTVTSRAAVVDADVAIGGDPSTGAVPLDGTLDEVRLEDVARDGAWLAAQVANQSSPATFASIGAAASGSWFGAGTWAARTPLTVDAGVVDAAGSGTDLTDFPLLVSFTDAALGASAQADARDLVFTADDGSTRLDHEIESWDGSTGTLVAWVRVPLLSATLDTRVFVYHGNAAAVDQQDPDGVWGPEHRAVFHLADDPEEVVP